MSRGSASASNADDAFRVFLKEDDILDVLSSFNRLCESIGLPEPRHYASVYKTLKSAVQTVEAVKLWKLLDERAAHSEYGTPDGRVCRNKTVLIVGAGPCGLRMAIECAFLGARAVVIEKRPYFSRNNILHLWPFAMIDLKCLGAKMLCPKFGSGCLDNISTRKLQLLLLKVALLLGVEVHTPVTFNGLREPDAERGNRWRADFGSEASKGLAELSFDVVVGADGRHQTVPGFNQKFTRGKMAIAITFHFVNKKTKAENRLKEVPGLIYFCDQNFFNTLKGNTGIDLENFVYYKDETHYFVMCAKKASLLAKGVLIKDNIDAASLLDKKNVNRSALLSFAREATASTMGQIPDLEFSKNHNGDEDVNIFDFTNVYYADNSCCVKERNGQSLLLCCIGDALSQPFWPTGTGIAKGFLSVFDSAWLMRNWVLKERPVLELIAERENVYKLLSQSKPDNINQHPSKYTIDPETRYMIRIQNKVMTSQVAHLYEKTSPTANDSTDPQLTDTKDSQVKKLPGVDGKSLLRWFQNTLEPFKDVAPIENLSSSWKNGLAFSALVQRYRPNIMNVRTLDPADAEENICVAFEDIEREFGVSPLLTPEDFTGSKTPDHLSMISYLFQLQQALKDEALPPGIKKDRPAKSQGLSTKLISASRKLSIMTRKENSLKRQNDGPLSLNPRHLSTKKLHTATGFSSMVVDSTGPSSMVSSRSKVNRKSIKNSCNLYNTLSQQQSLRHTAGGGEASIGDTMNRRTLTMTRRQAINRKTKAKPGIAPKPPSPPRQLKTENIGTVTDASDKRSSFGNYGHHPSLMACHGIASQRLSAFKIKSDGITATVPKPGASASSSNKSSSDPPSVVPRPAPRGIPRTIKEEDRNSSGSVGDVDGRPSESWSTRIKSDEPDPGPVLNLQLDDQSKFSSSEICSICEKNLYVVDKQTAHGFFFHGACYKCCECGSPLRLDTSFVKLDDNDKVKFYCSTHYDKAGGDKLIGDEWVRMDVFKTDDMEDDVAGLPVEKIFLSADSSEEEEEEEGEESPLDDDGGHRGDSDSSNQSEEELLRYRTGVSLRMIVGREIQLAMEEVDEEENQLIEQGRIMERTLRGRRQSRLSAAEENEELVRDWLNVIQSKIMLADKQSTILLRARLLELQQQESVVSMRLSLLKESPNHEYDSGDWIDDELNQLTSQIADLQDFLDISQQLPDGHY